MGRIEGKEQLWTVKDVAAYLQLEPKTVYKMLWGEVSGLEAPLSEVAIDLRSPGSARAVYRFKPSDVEEWADKHTYEPEAGSG